MPNDVDWDVVFVLSLGEEDAAKAQAKQDEKSAVPTKPPGRVASGTLAFCNILALAAGAILVAFGMQLNGWYMSGMLPQVVVIGAIALGCAVLVMALLGCIGAVASSRQALLFYLLLLLPCLLGAAIVAGLSMLGEDNAIATLEELGSDERAPLAAIGNGTTPSLGSGDEETLKTLYSSWESLYLDCAPVDNLEGTSVACSSNDSWAADFGAWANDECVEGANEFTVANCTVVVSALANTSGADDGAVRLFCACANAVAAEMPSHTLGAKATSLVLCGLLVVLLLITWATDREVAKRAKALEKARRPQHVPREELLWDGLQLTDKEQEERPKYTDLELIKLIKKRIVDAGLCVRLLKLIPEPDEAVEQADEGEFSSGHMVALLAIGEGTALDARNRLRHEAEHIGLRLPTTDKLGKDRVMRTEFKVENKRRFEPFTSAVRQSLILRVLEASTKRNRGLPGAGLDLEALQGSGRVCDVFVMHDDDEADALLKTWWRSPSIGCRRLKPQELRGLQDYLGTELAFYFSWATFYTRYLWPVAFLGLIFYIAQLQLEATFGDSTDAELASNVSEIGSGDTGWLETGSGLGLANVTNSTSSDDPSPEKVTHSLLTALYALFMSAWATMFTERWKQRSKLLSLDWDVLGQGLDMSKRLPLHPNFREDAVKPGFYTPQGDWVSLDDEKIKEDERALFADGNVAPIRTRWLDPWRHLRRHMASTFVIVFSSIACIFAIIGILIVRLFLAEWNSTYGGAAASLINAIVIGVFNAYWRKIALWLTNWENFRLEKEFRRELVLRMFAFQFINCYFSLFYIAFLKRYGVRYSDTIYDKCEPQECVEELRTLIFFILLNNIVVGSAMEMWLPFQKKLVTKVTGCIKDRMKSKVGPVDDLSFAMDLAEISRKKRAKKKLTASEEEQYEKHQADMELVEQYERPPLKSVRYGLGATFYEYNELALQFGYITMFSAVLPIGAMFAVANNYLEIRLDALKVLESTRRVKPCLVDGIGAWRTVLETLSYLGILTNLLILAFTSDFLDTFGIKETWERVGFVVVVEHALLAFKLFIDWVSADIPASVRKTLERDKWLAQMSFIGS